MVYTVGANAMQRTGRFGCQTCQDRAKRLQLRDRGSAQNQTLSLASRHHQWRFAAAGGDHALPPRPNRSLRGTPFVKRLRKADPCVQQTSLSPLLTAASHAGSFRSSTPTGHGI